MPVARCVIKKLFTGPAAVSERKVAHWRVWTVETRSRRGTSWEILLGFGTWPGLGGQRLRKATNTRTRLARTFGPGRPEEIGRGCARKAQRAVGTAAGDGNGETASRRAASLSAGDSLVSVHSGDRAQLGTGSKWAPTAQLDQEVLLMK